MNILNWIYEIRSYATAYTTRIKAWWLVALIWALVAAAVVFFYGNAVSFGTWRPFERFETRLYTVGAIALAYVLYCVWYLVRGRRREGALIDAVADGQADPAKAAAEDVAELRTRLRTALKLLRRTLGRRSIYALPWYALIGPPGSGKTTALQNSGLRFPLADTMGESVEGVGGTRNCDWWFTDEAILIDVASIGGITGRIREISDVATAIAAAVEEQGAATQEIVRNVAQAATGTGDVTGNIAGVAGAAEETGAAASQVLGAASELSRQSEHLTAEVARFLATVRAA